MMPWPSGSVLALRYTEFNMTELSVPLWAGPNPTARGTCGKPRPGVEGHYYFVDRRKDAIRRRGENISTFEVEAELLAHPQVQKAAVVAVPGDGGEDEVLAVLVTDNGITLDIQALTDFLAPRLAYFMVPRYFRFLSELPKTPTQKTEKHVLRNVSITADTIDREAQEIVLKKEKLDSRQ